MGKVSTRQIAPCDVIFNLLGEVDKSGGQFEAVTKLCADLGKPVLNPISAILRTGRDQAQALFGAIPGLAVPKIRWIERDELAELDVDRPLLIRPAGAHGGRNLALVEHRSQVQKYLEAVPYAGFLLTDFYDFKSSDGHYRKYRMIFVDRIPYPYHLAIGDHWMVHYFRAEMGESFAKRQEEQHFLEDWESVFGKAGHAAVQAVAQSLDLDYGGMDCSILPDGRVLFFEANACMLVHLDDPVEQFAYKHRTIPRIRQAVSDMIRRKIGSGVME